MAEGDNNTETDWRNQQMKTMFDASSSLAVFWPTINILALRQKKIKRVDKKYCITLHILYNYVKIIFYLICATRFSHTHLYWALNLTLDLNISCHWWSDNCRQEDEELATRKTTSIEKESHYDIPAEIRKTVGEPGVESLSHFKTK